MEIDSRFRNRSHGSGAFKLEDFGRLGQNCIFEAGVLVFHPENIEIGDDVYIGHNTILKGYFRNKLVIGAHTWIGQGCFFHSAGGLEIGRAVGIGPMVKILTSAHVDEEVNIPVYFNNIRLAPVVLKDGCDVGIGTTILPGITIGEGAIVGAGSVVTHDVPDYQVWAGVPARFFRDRRKADGVVRFSS